MYEWLIKAERTPPQPGSERGQRILNPELTGDRTFRGDISFAELTEVDLAAVY